MSEIQRCVSINGMNGSLEIRDNSEHEWIDLQILGKAGGVRAAVRVNRDVLAEALEKFWPGEVAVQFKEKEA